ncbi:MAG: hypothetical protein L0177_11795 [Chloroflexi bacterium]|nr:hypothetical protein [Chloroflexota bacterium]
MSEKEGDVLRAATLADRFDDPIAFEQRATADGIPENEGPPQLTLDGSEHVQRRERKSFFKRLFERDHPHLRVDHEDVLWFQKE